ncbi:anhydro-N-acetylmuramic acid kinase [Botrimarina hoheduenensis]|uniref:Anhydro-N-acetylmuramic acid kinase n=1 Tax=Botrimarina hoheduenensis TaxID=2528000 RepID=A0A5C5WE02_9BACT|nr:anhydro-N-acetylmuramic acid kinase [Botrimarina hoheduenensis]TWT48830.1 Anhydro-N-acetylmuramic acid kinase [Botrimarina hoheduenensis]
MFDVIQDRSAIAVDGPITAIGLMSGTSADGADAALLRTDGAGSIEFVGGLTLSYDEDLRSRLLEASQHDVPLTALLVLERDVTDHHAKAIEKLLKKYPQQGADAKVVGFHGHTIRHIPDERLTMQIGNPWQLSESVGLPVVADFRRGDIAAGGQGAPLAAMFHRALFASEKLPVAVLNLGGVANVTWLGPDDALISGDTGPGCGLLDEWAQEMAGLPHDQDGKLALRGSVDDAVVAAALSAPFFARALPKAADRYDFDHVDVSMLSVEDGAATLCAVTARAVVEAIDRLPAKPGTLWVTGGGVHHPVIMQMLGEHFDSVHSVDERNLNSETLEAECFAWLAVRRLRGLPITAPETTGCREPRCGGAVTC